MSHTHLPAQAVRAAAERYLQNAARVINAEHEKMIDQRMGYSAAAALRRWFGLPRITREAAIAHLKQGGDHGIISEWSMASRQGSYWSGVAKVLIDLSNARLATGGGTVAVDDIGIQAIKDYL